MTSKSPVTIDAELLASLYVVLEHVGAELVRHPEERTTDRVDLAARALNLAEHIGLMVAEQ